MATRRGRGGGGGGSREKWGYVHPMIYLLCCCARCALPYRRHRRFSFMQDTLLLETVSNHREAHEETPPYLLSNRLHEACLLRRKKEKYFGERYNTKQKGVLHTYCGNLANKNNGPRHTHICAHTLIETYEVHPQPPLPSSALSAEGAWSRPGVVRGRPTRC